MTQSIYYGSSQLEITSIPLALPMDFFHYNQHLITTRLRQPSSRLSYLNLEDFIISI